ncbi:MAG: type II toxin-antitoxin system RelE/ParE family toxin [Phaeodactylibacter sp.]|nr:type II toxin-antitoxin system RelE/ParE family toxin [Phaeodactylibacter sp.]MCB9265605.1 type II toxin-antitoxin system RelE/ParE family toxin [Lewinellaceae bacterium]
MSRKYQIRIKKSAQKEIKSLPKGMTRKVVNAINSLGDDPRPPGCKKLTGHDNYWRIRVGNYRILYSVHDNILVIEIIAVRHRKDAY